MAPPTDGTPRDADPPAVLPVRPQGIPASLRAIPRWVAWRWEPTGNPEKPWTKVPVDVRTGRRASSTDPSTWATFREALAYARTHDLAGVGFVFLPDDGIAGVDLDKARDPATGELTTEATAIVTSLGSYTEASPSGTGVHVLVVAELPPGRRKQGSIEMYDRGRFFTVTGHRIPGTPATLNPAQDAVAALHARVFGATTAPDPPRAPGPSVTRPDLSDLEVVARALAAKNADKVRRLLAGDRDGYASRSEADLALVSLLAFWAGDASQLDRLFRGSGLMRAKWDERHFGDGRTYGDATIAKALDRAEVWESSPRIVLGPGRDGPPPVDGEDSIDVPALVAVPPFPVAALPPLARALVVDGAAAIGCPPDFVAVPLLAFAGAVAGKHRSLRLKEGFVVRPIFWTGVVGAPGTAKSPALDLARAPLDRLQRLAWDRYQADLVSWEEAPPRERGARPRPGHFFATDTTTEAVAFALTTSAGIAIVHDELAGWVAGFDAYRKAGDRQTWLSSWSGSPLKPNRKGGDPIYIPDPVVCVTGGIQPDLLPTLAGEAARNDGFLPRLLLAWPDAAPSPWTEDVIAEKTVAALTESLGPLRTTGDALVCLEPAAYREWTAWYGENVALVAGSTGLAAGWAAKAPVHLARIALALHLLAHPKEINRRLSADTLRDAIAVVEYFRAHLRRVLPAFGAVSLITGAGLAARVLRILTAAYPEWVGRAEIAIKLSGHENSRDVTLVLVDLEERGAVERQAVATEGRSRTEWRWTGPHAEAEDLDHDGGGGFPRNHVTTEHTTVGLPPESGGDLAGSGEESLERDKWKDVIRGGLSRNHVITDDDEDEFAGWDHVGEGLL